MSNMSYCRFSNTASDLQDCADHLRSLDSEDRSSNNIDEIRARGEIIRLAALICEEAGISDPSDSWAVDNAIDAFASEPCTE